MDAPSRLVGGEPCYPGISEVRVAMAVLPDASLLPVTAGVTPRNHLTLGGCDVVDLAREFGTPLYVYDEATLRHMAGAFTSAFSSLYPNSRVLYACKAFVNVGLARLLAGYGLGFDVVSGGEMAVVRAADIHAQSVYFHGNNKSQQELEEAVAWGIGRVVVDGLREIELLDSAAGKAGLRQPVLIRVSPDIDPHSHRHTTTGVLDSKFGLPIATGDAEEAVRRVIAAPHLELFGLHFHLGSPIFHVAPYEQAIRVVTEFASRMRGPGLVLREFSPGGGFAVAYTDEDNPPSPAQYAEAIVRALRESLSDLSLEEPHLLVEPGRAIVARAGVALYTVGGIKRVPDIRTYVAVDGGMGDNIRPALYGARYKALAAERATDPATETVTLAGKYCESGDILVRDASLATVQPGDLVAVPAAGAYAPAMASTYNLNGRPAIVLVEGGEARLLRRRESYADLMATDVV